MTRADLSLSSRPLERLRLRGAASYDERDNDSRQAAFTSIVHTDLFPVGRGSHQSRLRLRAHARQRLGGLRRLRRPHVGVGGEWRTTDRTGTAVEVTGEEVLDGWGRVQWRPSGYLGIVLKGGAEEREPDQYDVDVAVGYGQNPLLRKYNQAYRYRSYGELVGNVAIGSLPLSLGVNVHYGDDSYMRSALGLVSGLDRRYGADLNWTVSENISAYASAGREKIDARTTGSSIFAGPDWTGEVKDDFETYGAGMNAKLSDRLGLTLDYTYADGDSNTALQGAGSGQFPTVKSELSSFKAAVTYGVNERADLRLAWWYETLKTSDWAYTPQPAALPTVLGLGIDPYNYDVNYVTLSLRYRFGGPPAAETAAE